MCDTADDGVGLSASITAELKLRNRGLRTADIAELMPFARQLVNSRENRDSHIGFVGYDKTNTGNKILIAIDREYNLDVPHAVAAALREKGAHVDILVAASGQSGTGSWTDRKGDRRRNLRRRLAQLAG